MCFRLNTSNNVKVLCGICTYCCWLRSGGVNLKKVQKKEENWVTKGKFTQHKKRKCLETSIATYARSSQSRNRKYEEDRKKQIHISETQMV